MLSFCPKCQLDVEPWEVLTTADGGMTECKKHGNMNADELMTAKAALDVIGKSLHYLVIAPDQNNGDKHSNSRLPRSV